MQRPNIIFFICHDLGKHLGCYGTPGIESPNIDAFAQRGIQFNNAFCAAAACSPSRGCIMTGQYSHTNSLIGLSHQGWGLPDHRRTIVDELNDAGYETVHIGHNHERHVGANHYQIDLEESATKSRTDHVVDDAIAFLESRRDAEAPFYLNLGVNEVHAHHFNQRYDDPYGGEVPPEDVFVPNYSPDGPPIRKQLGRFQAAIRYMDHHVGRLLDAIEAKGYLDNSIVVFTTDHGISGSRAKGTLYDRGMEVAFIAHAPKGMRNGFQVDDLVSNIDHTPTFLEAAGVPIPEAVQGHSYLPLLTGERYASQEAIFTERNFHDRMEDEAGNTVEGYDPQRSIRTKRFHYIRKFRPEVSPQPWMPWEDIKLLGDGSNWHSVWPEMTAPRPTEELFDLDQDPGEFFNLIDKPEYRRVKEQLSKQLDQWMQDTADFALMDGYEPKPTSPEGWGYPRETSELATMRIAAGADKPNATNAVSVEAVLP